MKTRLKSDKNLEGLIQSRIKNRGPITFADFMECVLYHPELGYYSKSRRSEDYYTNADVHPVFAQILAQFMYREWKNSFKETGLFSVVELGCGNGKLSGEILKWISKNAPDFYSSLKYTCVERSPERRKSCEILKQTFLNRVVVTPEYNFEQESLTGIVFSNEFFDALPFHRVMNTNGELFEILIAEDFREVHEKLSRPLKNYFDWLGTIPRKSCMGEAHLNSKEWIGRISRSLLQGWVITIDYGYHSREIYSDFRTEGTALCHYRHKTNRDFYRRLGEQDITAHVNFTTLIKEAQNWNLQSLPIKTQSQFLIDNGLDLMVQGVRDAQNPRTKLKASAGIRSLIHPEGMGGTFKILLQKKTQ